VHIHSFAEDNLKYVVLDLLIAGTETTVTTIQWAVQIAFFIQKPCRIKLVRIRKYGLIMHN
jgi:hypothetical protein